ncbi:hydrogenase nickel incorporation protein HypB [Streptomyces sp. NPDC054766]|uniref:hydrogenase nickel incorporation protein HypB n=1 Tax=Streptomyces rhizosphaerihabitans TaxID=1266770 RepID=UPI0021C21D20|nr:hydrogenase nickel incorporation protein HypB [Streptomyces rhizosphaerihabitans]MCT9005884.1 hydrogenase nickel incorporation protein HypB [Streptomyces rhizosphaerihabitans]
MCRTVDLHQAVLAKNDENALALRSYLGERGTVAVNLLSSPGSGKTALLEQLLARAVEGGTPAAAVTADLATENDATRLARSGAPVQQILTDGLCHLEAGMLRRRLEGWLPEGTRLLFVENVGNLVCPASYDLGETLRIALASVTEGEDKPVKYPTAFGLAHLVVITKTDIADAVGFDREAFLRGVQQVNPGVPVLETSARTGQGVDALLTHVLRCAAGDETHVPVLARQHERYLHSHENGHGQPQGDGHAHGDGNGIGHIHAAGHPHGDGHEHAAGHPHERESGAERSPAPGHTL